MLRLVILQIIYYIILYILCSHRDVQMCLDSIQDGSIIFEYDVPVVPPAATVDEEYPPIEGAHDVTFGNITNIQKNYIISNTYRKFYHRF